MAPVKPKAVEDTASVKSGSSNGTSGDVMEALKMLADTHPAMPITNGD